MTVLEHVVICLFRSYPLIIIVWSYVDFKCLWGWEIDHTHSYIISSKPVPAACKLEKSEVSRLLEHSCVRLIQTQKYWSSRSVVSSLHCVHNIEGRISPRSYKHVVISNQNIPFSLLFLGSHCEQLSWVHCNDVRHSATPGRWEVMSGDIGFLPLACKQTHSSVNGVYLYFNLLGILVPHWEEKHRLALIGECVAFWLMFLEIKSVIEMLSWCFHTELVRSLLIQVLDLNQKSTRTQPDIGVFDKSKLACAFLDKLQSLYSSHVNGISSTDIIELLFISFRRNTGSLVPA